MAHTTLVICVSCLGPIFTKVLVSGPGYFGINQCR